MPRGWLRNRRAVRYAWRLTTSRDVERLAAVPVGLNPPARRRKIPEADQADLPSPDPFAKIFLFPLYPNHLYIHRHPVPQRGVGHRHERWGGMRWTRQRPRARGIAGRNLRERSPGAQTNGAVADGEVVWS